MHQLTQGVNMSKEALQGAKEALELIDSFIQANEYFISSTEMYGQELGVHRGLWIVHDKISKEIRQLDHMISMARMKPLPDILAEEENKPTSKSKK